jgi:hypothetical protein
MISPLCTDKELIQACRHVEGYALRVLSDRLERRCMQLDTVRKLASSDRVETDPVGLLSDIEQTSLRD